MTQGVSITVKALTAAVLTVALFVAVVLQLTLVNRLPLPGATAPDLVLLLVTAIAVTTGPAAGAVAGFAGGLALDVAPPTAHYAGEYALVFCLTGYAAAYVVQAIWDRSVESDPVIILTVMVVAAAAGEAGKAVLGMLLSDPDVTGSAVSGVLPVAISYDLLLSPLVLWPVARLTRGAIAWNAASWNAGAAERAPAPEFGRAGQLAVVFRQASAGAAPNLRLAGTGENHRRPSPHHRLPKLRLSAASSGSRGGTSSASSAGVSRPSSRRSNGRALSEKKGFPEPGRRAGPQAELRRRQAAGTAGRVARTPGRNWLRGASARSIARSQALAGAKGAGRTPGKDWLRSAASPAVPVKRAGRSPSRGWLSAAAAPARGGRRGGRRGGLTHRRAGGLSRGLARGFAAYPGGVPAAARPARSAAEVLAARSAPSGLSALSGAGTPLARRRSPSRGWLSVSRSAAPAVSARRRYPRGGWLGAASRPRAVIGSGVRGRGPTFRRRRTVLGNTVLGNTVLGNTRLGNKRLGNKRLGNTMLGHRGQGNWYAASPSGAWLRRGRRKTRLLRLLGGHR